MKRFLFLFLVVLSTLFAGPIGCTEAVPGGFVGRTWEPHGFEGGLLKPGRHACWGRCQMYLMESTDKTFTVPMSVLCDDSLNFSFNIDVLVAPNFDVPAAVTRAFENLRPQSGNVFTLDQLFATYVRPVADQEARKVVSKYKTEEIVRKRVQIIEEVRTAVLVATSESLLKVKRVTVGNLDFPDIITRAQEAKAQRRVEIDTARAEGMKRAAEAEAKLKLARLEAQRELVEAQAIADANRIIATSITPQYLAYKQIEALKLAADGDNNMFLVPYTDAVNQPLDTSRWDASTAVMDASLIERIRQANEVAAEPVEDSPPPGDLPATDPMN